MNFYECCDLTKKVYLTCINHFEFSHSEFLQFEDQKFFCHSLLYLSIYPGPNQQAKSLLLTCYAWEKQTQPLDFFTMCTQIIWSIQFFGM